MAAEAAGIYTFDGTTFAPHTLPDTGNEVWSEYLSANGYGDQEQVWGIYPDSYVRVVELLPESKAEFAFAATVNLIYRPHHVLIRDLNGLISLLNLLLPLLNAPHSRPNRDTGDALFGSQGAQEEGLNSSGDA